MREIAVPEDPDALAALIHKYFYGSFPNYHMIKDDGGKGYISYDGKKESERSGPEPEPMDVIRQHVAGKKTWATRATIKDSDLRKAYFAAIDVDTTDEKLLQEMRGKLNKTYGPIYNWERSQSGVHVWFVFEGSMSRAVLLQFMDLLPSLSPKLQKRLDVQSPKKQQAIRLPFPGAYDPPSTFDSSHLKILEAEDIANLLGIEPTVVKHDPTDLPVSVMHDSATCPRDYWGKKNNINSSTTSSLWDTYTPQYLKAEVDQQLGIPPVDSAVYSTLIMEGLLAKTIAVYGEKNGLMALESWIRTGTPEKVHERIADLHKYHRADAQKGYWTISGPPCPPALLDYYEFGLFESELGFISRSDIREEAGAVLYILCVCHVVAEHLSLNEWYLSTRQLSELLKHMGFEGYEDVDEGGRKKAGRILSWVVEGLGENDLPVFQITKDSTQYAARRFSLNPDYESLLDLLPESLMKQIQAIPNYGRKKAAEAAKNEKNLNDKKRRQSQQDDEFGGLLEGAIPWDQVA